MRKLTWMVLLVTLVVAEKGLAQCGSAQGNQTSFGSSSWIGYFYDGADNYNSSNYYGYNTESANFDESFCGDNCNYAINGCSVNTETFTVRYKMRMNFSNSLYRLTIGGDDGVRLSVDNGSSYVLDGYSQHSYTTYSTIVNLNGNTRMILEYYENGGQNRVSFSYTDLGSSYGGEIGSDQSLCGSAPFDPAAFTSIEDAMFTTGASISYQWQVSTDNSTWSNVSGATSNTYDIPSGFPAGTTYYYRRRARNGSSTVYSNTVTVSASSNAASGDQVTYGSGSWIGYAYDGADNYSSNYYGEIFESSTFDESFGGDYVNKGTTGCTFYTETYSVRFKMQQTLGCGDYTFTVGADDGVRLSLDGGATWIIDDYSYHSYRTSSTTISLADGTYNMVLEYFEGGGGNRVSFDYSFVSCILPVTWHSFEGEAFIGYNQLTWQTASEKNNDGFEVERSIDGSTYQTLGWIDGHGTTTTAQSYSFRDDSPASGTIYYRLRQVDFDKKYEYSSIVSVTTQSAPEKNISLYPNPAHDYVMVNVDGVQVTMQLVNIQSSQMVQLTSDEYGKFDLTGMAPGIYAARIKVGDKVYLDRLLIQP